MKLAELLPARCATAAEEPESILCGAANSTRMKGIRQPRPALPDHRNACLLSALPAWESRRSRPQTGSPSLLCTSGGAFSAGRDRHLSPAKRCRPKHGTPRPDLRFRLEPSECTCDPSAAQNAGRSGRSGQAGTKRESPLEIAQDRLWAAQERFPRQAFHARLS
jgi:hypothetical protein